MAFGAKKECEVLHSRWNYSEPFTARNGPLGPLNCIAPRQQGVLVLLGIMAFVANSVGRQSAPAIPGRNAKSTLESRFNQTGKRFVPVQRNGGSEEVSLMPRCGCGSSESSS
jgi:hypothetical protein